MAVPTTLDRGRPKSPCARPQREPLAAAGPYVPPRERLSEAYTECARLDRELLVIENSGHAKLGVFAKPLGDQQRCRVLAAAAKQDRAQHLPEDPLSETVLLDDDDVTSDPFFHRFYDEQGRSTYEQLLRSRMRVLALVKMVFTRDSVAYVRADVELAETYARMNLWKQTHAHVVTASERLKRLDDARANQQHALKQQLQASGEDDDTDDHGFSRLLEFFYGKQLDEGPAGEVVKSELLHEAAQWKLLAFGPILARTNVDALFGAAPFLHWQQLLLRMERQSALFHDFLRVAELRIPESTRAALRLAFEHLDPSHFGVVPLHTLTEFLESTSTEDTIVDALRRHHERVAYPSVTWSELIHVALQCVQSIRTSSSLVDENDAAKDLRPRLKFLFGRVCLRKGQLDDAMRYMETAIAEHEAVFGRDIDTLVPLYLSMAETLSVRYKQLAVIAQQTAFDMADKWLKTTDGSRRLRAKALDVVERASRENPGKTLPSKKDAEVHARDELLKEYAGLSLVRPDATTIEDAIEYCTKAWRLQEATHGRDYITTASVHVTLAQIHALQQHWDDSVRFYEQAIAMYEASCDGPVPASATLKLAVAKIFHHQLHRTTEAAAIYDDVGSFFHSFALEFASSDATRRESCTQAIDAWRQWLAIAPGTLDDQKRILSNIYEATVDGVGEFSVEAAESSRELAHHLIQMGQLRAAQRHLRTAWYVLESHFGPNDRRTRKARKELVELSNEAKGAALDSPNDHEWLTL